MLAVLPTAFDDSGRLDRAGVDALVGANRAAGVSGFVVLGVMGEAAELSDRERNDVLRVVTEGSGDLPVVVGISGETVDAVAHRAEDATRSGASAVMVSPARSLPIGEAIGAASRAGLSIVIQDYPAGSGVTISVEEVVAAADASPLVAGLKAEAPPTSAKIAEVRERLPDLPVFGGLGGMFLVDELRAGAAGTMTGFALPERLVAVVRRFADDPDAADRDWQRLLPLMRFEAFPPLSLAARKEVWRLRGVIGSAFCRRPGAVLDRHTREDVRRAFESVMAPEGV